MIYQPILSTVVAGVAEVADAALTAIKRYYWNCDVPVAVVDEVNSWPCWQHWSNGVMNFASLNYFGKTATSSCGCCCFYCSISHAVPHGGDEAAAAAAAVVVAAAAAEVTKSISGQDEAASYW